VSNFPYGWLNRWPQLMDQGDDPGRVEDFKRMACTDHVCRACKHSWFSNTNDEVCELCGGDDIQDIFDESSEDTE
jgi:rubrerythrin